MIEKLIIVANSNILLISEVDIQKSHVLLLKIHF